MMGAFQGQRPEGPKDNESTRRHQEALAKGQAEQRLRNMEERLIRLEAALEATSDTLLLLMERTEKLAKAAGFHWAGKSPELDEEAQRLLEEIKQR